jgi:hypothetical protein
VTTDLLTGSHPSINTYKVKVLNFPAPSFDLTVLSDHRSPDGISSVDSLLHPYAVISVFKRIVPPYAGLLRSYAFTTASPVLDGFFKEGISMGRFTQGTT